MTKFVRCIEDDLLYLTKNKVYEVVSTLNEMYRVYDDTQTISAFYKHRFEVVENEETMTTEDNGLIDKQEHYTNNGIQPIEIMKKNMTTEAYRGFLEGNILKYPLRYKDKNGLEDLQKAKTYLTWLIEDIEERGL